LQRAQDLEVERIHPRGQVGHAGVDAEVQEALKIGGGRATSVPGGDQGHPGSGAQLVHGAGEDHAAAQPTVYGDIPAEPWLQAGERHGTRPDVESPERETAPHDDVAVDGQPTRLEPDVRSLQMHDDSPVQLDADPSFQRPRRNARIQPAQVGQGRRPVRAKGHMKPPRGLATLLRPQEQLPVQARIRQSEGGVSDAQSLSSKRQASLDAVDPERIGEDPDVGRQLGESSGEQVAVLVEEESVVQLESHVLQGQSSEAALPGGVRHGRYPSGSPGRSRGENLQKPALDSHCPQPD
jgi:hypothetical protein